MEKPAEQLVRGHVPKFRFFWVPEISKKWGYGKLNKAVLSFIAILDDFSKMPLASFVFKIHQTWQKFGKK